MSWISFCSLTHLSTHFKLFPIDKLSPDQQGPFFHGGSPMPKTKRRYSEQTFQNAEDANNQVWAGKVLDRKGNSVMNFVRSLALF